jgi:hypothetical protein
MSLVKERILIKNAMILVGFILIGISIFAKQLGIDNDEGWGAGRSAILAGGLAFIATGLIALKYPERFSETILFLAARKYLLSAVALVFILYIWVSQLNVKDLREGYQYYAELGKSFKNGTLYLAAQPSQALLALPNPYDYDLRVQRGVEDFPWDVSLYKGRFYLYYGPVPALLVSFFNDDLLSQVGDRHLAIVFASGLFLYEMLILLKFFARRIPDAPDWLAGIAILTLGLTAPTAIMLHESRIYQVAVFGSQFFFIGGCYWIYAAITKPRLNAWKLGLAGIHWALALGTRSAIAPVILYSTLIAMIGIFVLYKPIGRGGLLSIFSLVSPLLFGTASLALYNLARFESATEFGLKYTLTNMNYLTGTNVFATSHMANNFYNYFVHPLRLSPQFPYLFRIEYIFSSERLGGLLYIAPYILLALLPSFAFRKLALAQKTLYSSPVEKIVAEFWLLIIFAGAAIIGAIVIHMFWTTEMRYIEDFMPSLILFTNANVALGYDALKDRPRWRTIFNFVTVLLASITIIAGTLVALKPDSLLFWGNLIDRLLRIVNLR